MRRGIVAAILVVYTILGYRYVQTFQSDLTAWTRARQLAPQKLRPWLNDTKLRFIS